KALFRITTAADEAAALESARRRCVDESIVRSAPLEPELRRCRRVATHALIDNRAARKRIRADRVRTGILCEVLVLFRVAQTEGRRERVGEIVRELSEQRPALGIHFRIRARLRARYERTNHDRLRIVFLEIVQTRNEADAIEIAAQIELC